MHSVFLSHSSKDRELVFPLYMDLEKIGIKVWFDEVEMEPGDLLVDRIGSGLRSSMNLAVALSANSVNSKWVQKEVSIALTRQLAGSNVKVIPMRLDDAELPTFLSDVKYVDFRESGSVRSFV